jgi:glycine oxidase
VDRGDLGQQASWAGAGIIPPGNPEQAPSPYDRLRALSSQMYPRLSGQLREETSLDNGYLVCGGIELLDNGEDAAVEEWQSEGIVFRKLDGAGLRRHEPGLADRVSRGYYLPGMAQVRNPRHVKALRAACGRRGVQLRPGCAVHGLVRRGERVEGVDTEQGRLGAGRFLIAAGAWADELLQQAGWKPGIHPVRGQIALLNTGISETRPILLQGKCYLVPRGDGRLLVGSTEEDAGFDARPTAAAVAGLLTFAASLVPGLAQAHLERCWAGLRPGSPDGLPFLGQVPGCSNLYVAAGHFRSGIQLSPATALVMKELLLGQPLTIPLTGFRLDRPPSPPAQTAFRS